MKIGSAINAEAYVHLPTEILQLVISFVKGGNDGQRNLWACCLVSRHWYSAAVPLLYESPSLQGRNFESFSQTLCPPVNAHIRHVELAQFVKQLDMSTLAYESSNSTTARLLRRVKGSLESFNAPAKSFSFNGFIPLSKCHRIRHINLYQMFESLTFQEVLRPFRTLPNLTAFAFPRNTTYFKYNLSDSETVLWPSNLQEVTLSGIFCSLSSYWGQYVRDWPSSLQHLNLDNCFDFDRFSDDSSLVAQTAFKLKSVYITGRTSAMCPRGMALIFSGLESLSLPANLLRTDYYSRLFRPILEELEIRESLEPRPHKFDPQDIWNHARSIPTLRQIRVHRSLVAEDCPVLHVADQLLKTRGAGETGTVSENTGVVIYDD